MRSIPIFFITGIAFLTALAFWQFGMTSYFAPKYAAIDNHVFHESAQYNDGMIRDLENLEIQYRQGTDAEKAALKAVVIHRFSIYPEDRLPNNLRTFYNQVRGN